MTAAARSRTSWDCDLTAHLLRTSCCRRARSTTTTQPIEGIRRLLQLPAGVPIDSRSVSAVKMATTVATNALLEHNGEPTALFITHGFGDALRIGYQNRPRLFDRQIQLPAMLHSRVFEVEERISAAG